MNRLNGRQTGRWMINEQVQDLYRAGPRDIFSLFLRLVLQNCWIPATEILLSCCRGGAESPIDFKSWIWSLLVKSTVLQTYCRLAAGMLQRCCKSAAALLERCCRINFRSYIPNSKFLGWVYLLECCKPAAEIMQTCSRNFTDLLLPCCRGAAESPVDAAYPIWSLKVKSIF